MARKPILTGGKRDEIITEATKLFFENGYESTSVRMIMNKVGGEIGMFYHYFKSKDALFDCVVERFFDGYKTKFESLINTCDSPESFIDNFLPVYAGSMEQFGMIKGNMHWTIQLAMSAKTIASLIPAVIALLGKWDINSKLPKDMLAAQLVYGISATIHSKSFEPMDSSEKRKCLLDLMNRILK